MSPIYISVIRPGDAYGFGLAAKISNSECVVVNTRDITIVDVGWVVNCIPMYSASHGQEVGSYKCVKNNDTGLYQVIRVTCGQNVTCADGVKKLKECQQFALLDHCNYKGLKPIQELKYEKRY